MRSKHNTPIWASRKQIREFYRIARLFGYHVDHIEPKEGLFVCGLHCEFNLQLLKPYPNIKKSNKQDQYDFFGFNPEQLELWRHMPIGATKQIAKQDRR